MMILEHLIVVACFALTAMAATYYATNTSREGVFVQIWMGLMTAACIAVAFVVSISAVLQLITS